MAAKSELSFTGYEKMGSDTNLWSTRKLDSIKQWIALEKIHGANFSFHVSQSCDDELEVKVAKRTSYLKEGEKFYQIQKQIGLIEGEKEKAKQLYIAVNESAPPGVQVVTVFGELFGGSYPHPSVPPCATASRIQREVLYCPDQKFLAYDIAVQESDPSGGSQTRRYLDYDVCMGLFKACGFLYAEPLATGTLQDMLNYPLGFVTTLPAKFGLPPLPDQKNTAEGIVIKPLKNILLESVKANNKPIRVIFKRKVDAFTERWPKTKERRPQKNKGVGYNQDFEFLKYEAMALVTEQRLVNTVSKFGLPDPEDGEEEWKVITAALADDVLDELKTDNEEQWSGCSKEPTLMGKLKAKLRVDCENMVDEYKEKQ